MKLLNAALDWLLGKRRNIRQRIGITGHLLVEQFGPDGKLKYRGETHNIVTDAGDILFSSLAYTAAPTFNIRLGSAATAVSKAVANAGAYISTAHGSTDSVASSKVAMDSTYPKAGTNTPGSGSQVIFKHSYTAGVISGTCNRVSLCDSSEPADATSGALTYAIALLPDKPVTMGAADTLVITWTITFLGS
jgi:hypothetical protein